ncbi:MAG TPA: restriction endonuclease subunit S, partial [Paracoccaceae bacterium]|nr:restriction endonuclease subunit S [Paracoccaceae bacterium]
MKDDYQLPPSWRMATLKDIGEIVSGGTPSTKDSANFDGAIPWVTPADLTGYTAKLISRGRRNISKQGLGQSSARILPKGAVLFSSRAPIGYVAIAAGELATNQGFKNLILTPNVEPDYVYFYLRNAKRLAEAHASGTTFKEISGARFAQLPIPVPPLAEQRRIVERIETLFARLEKGEEAVRQVQGLLRRYRQS